MMDSQTTRAWAIIIVFGIIIGYFSLSWAGVVPNEYNVIEHYFGNGETDNTTVIANEDYSVTIVRGLPQSPVNLSTSETQTYTIDFVASEGECDDFAILLDVDKSGTTASVMLTSAESNDGWEIMADGHYAYWSGEAVLPYDSVSLTLTITGDEDTIGGVIRVVTSSNGQTTCNTGLIIIQ